MGKGINKDWLEDQYIAQKKSMNEIDEEFGFYKGKTKHWMKKYNIEKRSISEAQKISMNRPETKKKCSEAHKREKGSNWKGGIIKIKGYIMILKSEHPNARKNGYIYEHILVAEKKLGRYLKPGEIVHHINGIKDDNRPENISICRNVSEHNDVSRSFFKLLTNLIQSDVVGFDDYKKEYYIKEID